MRSRKWHRSGGRERLYPTNRDTEGGILLHPCSSSDGGFHGSPTAEAAGEKVKTEPTSESNVNGHFHFAGRLPSPRSLASCDKVTPAPLRPVGVAHS